MESNEVTDYLTELSTAQLNLSLPNMLKVIEKLERLRILLSTDHLYTQRTVGLARGTTKDDPLDCSFVLRAMREMLTTNKDDLQEVKRLLYWLSNELGE
jgi:hypothetical protein